MSGKGIFAFLKYYAISPLHPGCGASTAVVDLPIQRERHTGWPHIQASENKGALRSHYRRFCGDGELINYIFGVDSDNDKNRRGGKEEILPGAISVSDARLLAFPMRSNIAPFVWVTCPAVLKRLERDLEVVGYSDRASLLGYTLGESEARCVSGNIQGDVVLEDMMVQVNGQVNIPVIGSLFSELERLLLVSDEVYTYCVTNCTEIQTQIKINAETGTAQDGALRYQELLPADSVLYSVIGFFDPVSSPKEQLLKADIIRKNLQDVVKDYIQVGGDQTLGRGICKITWYNPDEGGR